MRQVTRRGMKEGIEFGLVAGVIFAVMEMVGAAFMGDPIAMPFRMFASVLLGRDALMTTPLGTAFIVGAIMHLVLSGVFGLIYGLLGSRWAAETRQSWGREIVSGLLFGAALWFVNFQLIARAVYPWFLETPQFLQALMHSVFFGLPLALLYTAAERRIAVPVQGPEAVGGTPRPGL